MICKKVAKLQLGPQFFIYVIVDKNEIILAQKIIRTTLQRAK